MAKKKTQIPKYGTITLKGIQYYRTRITDADGKELSLYAATCEELYEKQLEDPDSPDSRSLFETDFLAFAIPRRLHRRPSPTESHEEFRQRFDWDWET